MPPSMYVCILVSFSPCNLKRGIFCGVPMILFISLFLESIAAGEHLVDGEGRRARANRYRQMAQIFLCLHLQNSEDNYHPKLYLSTISLSYHFVRTRAYFSVELTFKFLQFLHLFEVWKSCVFFCFFLVPQTQYSSNTCVTRSFYNRFPVIYIQNMILLLVTVSKLMLFVS